MKKLVLFKVLLVVGLSMILVSVLTGFSFADDPVNTSNSIFPNVFSNNEFENGTTVESINGAVNTVEPIENANNSVFDNVIDNNVPNGIEENYSLNEVNENVNELAYTGIEDYSGIVALIAVIGVIVSIYSYVKMKEYNI